MPRKTTPKLGRSWSVELTVVGMQFRWTKDGREMLRCSCPFYVVLEREPDNPADENAIKVNIASDHKLKKIRGMQLGYLRANIAALIAPKLDAGTTRLVSMWVTDIDPLTGEATAEARFRDLKKPAKQTKRKKA